MARLREFARKLLHRGALRCGFALTRVKPFERAILSYQLDHDDFFLVQIGAYNGVTSDPFCKFIIEKSWSGVLVEPQRRYWEVLQEIYRDRPEIACRRVAIASENATRKFYRVEDSSKDVPYWAPQIASFRYDVIVSHADQIPDLAEKIVAEEVECITLDTLVSQANLPRIDLLAIDVEGSDFEILQQIDRLPAKPKFVYFEHLHLSVEDREASVQFLHARGYRTHAVNAGDTFAELS